MSKFLRVLLIYTVSLCHVFTLVLAAAVSVLGAIMLNTNSGKVASVRCVPGGMGTEVRKSWEEH